MKNKLLLFTLLISCISLAQQKRLKYADKMYENSSYFYAASGYEDVLDRGIDSIQISSKIADCYDKMNNVEKAVQWYDFIENKNLLTQEQLLRSAIIRRELGDYNGSTKRLKLYESKYGSNELTKDIFIENNVNEIMINKYGFELSNSKINSQGSEFSVNYFEKNKVLVTADKKIVVIKRIHSWDAGNFYNTYYSTIKSDGSLGKLKKLKGDLNTKYHDGPVCYDSLTKKVYFTRDNYLNGDLSFDSKKLVRLKLYSAKLVEGKFIDIVELPFNSDEYSNGHPCLSSDGKTLYFSSDRPGGYGGSDIYKVAISDNGDFGKPVNMGAEINSILNEFTPFYNGEQNILFFSSEGHNGLGGFDVFAGKLDNELNCIEIENIGAPINSVSDDLSYCVNNSQTKGYLTSNRIAGKGNDDIYSFNQSRVIFNSPVLFGVLSDKMRKSIIPNEEVYLYDESNNLIDSSLTDSLGNYCFNLASKDKIYFLKVEKDEFIPFNADQKIKASDKKTEKNIELDPILEYYLSGLVRDKDTKELIDGVTVTITDKVTNEVVSTIVTQNGSFITETLKTLEFGDVINYEVKCIKKGYLTNTGIVKDVLAYNENINTERFLNFDMKRVIEGTTDLNDVIAINPIYFDYNKSDIRPDAALELDKIVKVMKENPGMVIELGSHTDSRGTDVSNLKLSDRRAKSSAAYIISQGIEASRIKGKGYGETKLKVSDQDVKASMNLEEQEKKHQKNRRTEFIIIKMK